MPRASHFRDGLLGVQDDCFVASTPDDVAKAVLHLVAVLQDDWDARTQVTQDQDLLRTLVREAADLLTNADSRVVVEHWLHTAGTIVDGIPQAGERGSEDHGFLGALAPIDPRD